MWFLPGNNIPIPLRLAGVSEHQVFLQFPGNSIFYGRLICITWFAVSK
jgi:hypothetical protein